MRIDMVEKLKQRIPFFFAFYLSAVSDLLKY